MVPDQDLELAVLACPATRDTAKQSAGRQKKARFVLQWDRIGSIDFGKFPGSSSPDNHVTPGSSSTQGFCPKGRGPKVAKLTQDLWIIQMAGQQRKERGWPLPARASNCFRLSWKRFRPISKVQDQPTRKHNVVLEGSSGTDVVRRLAGIQISYFQSKADRE